MVLIENIIKAVYMVDVWTGNRSPQEAQSKISMDTKCDSKGIQDIEVRICVIVGTVDIYPS